MDQFIVQHPYLFYGITLALASLVAWFIRQFFKGNLDALAKISASVSDIYDKYNDHEHRLSTLEGEHKVFSRLKGHGE